MSIHRLSLLAVIAALALGAAACGDDDDSGSSGAASTQLEQGGIADVQIDGADNLEAKPGVSVPNALPPAELETKDLVTGDGKRAGKGDAVDVQYVGVAWSNGSEFDTSWDGEKPFEFELDTGGVIKGWDQGIKGMREGGRRLLVIPPDLAYGEAGSAPIGPNETLVFVVDLAKVG